MVIFNSYVNLPGGTGVGINTAIGFPVHFTPKMASNRVADHVPEQSLDRTTANTKGDAGR